MGVALLTLAALGDLAFAPRLGEVAVKGRSPAGTSQSVPLGFKSLTAKGQPSVSFAATGSGSALQTGRNDGSYKLRAKNQMPYELAASGRKQPPNAASVINFTGIFGGAGTDGLGIVVDGAGNTYVTGLTYSAELPTTPGAFQSACSIPVGGTSNECLDAFVMKFDSSGSVIYSTYLGGTDLDIAYGIAVDSSGSAYVTGVTASSDFPVTPGGFQTSLRGCDIEGAPAQDAFVAKLSPDGSALIYSTYLGGSGCDGADAVVLSAAGEAFVTGYTDSTDFPVANALQPNLVPGDCSVAGITQRCNDAFITKLSPDGGSLVFSTYLGGASHDGGRGLALDAAGNAYVVGGTRSQDFPVTPGAFQSTLGPEDDAFVAKLDPAGGALIFSTFLGGNEGVSGADGALAISLDSKGNVWVAGYTQSTNFPTQNAFQPAFSGQFDGFVSVLTPDGASLLLSTYLGGSATQRAAGVAADFQGGAYVVGNTSSADFPTVSPFQSQCLKAWSGGDCLDIFLVHLNPDGSASLSTYLGGTGDDTANSVATDSQDGVYLAGATSSTDFGTATTSGAGSRSMVRAEPAEATASTKPGRPSGPMLFDPRTKYAQETSGLRGLVAKLSFVGPLASLSRARVDFGGELVGTTSAAQTITLQNTGDQSLFISGISATGDYALTHNCVSPLAAGAYCTINITFTPTVAGGQSGTLTTIDNAFGSPHTVALNGVGQDFSLGAFTTARAVSPGMTARFDLLLSPQGGFNQTVSLACSGAPAGATCSVRPSSVTPNGADNVSVALEVVTTAPAASAPRDDGGRRPVPPGGWPGATTLALLGALALLAGAILRRAASSARLRLLPVLGACLLLVALVWAACGGGGLYVRSGGTPAGTYMLTITATTSNLSHSTTVKLTVR